MYYFVYDLDETLAEVYSLFYFLMSLKVKNKVSKEIYESNRAFFNSLERGYYEFVKKVSKVEQSSAPLGILRPGILGVMKQLEELRENKKVKNVIIYSNNGSLENLEFIKDIIVDALMPSNNNILSLNEENMNKFISSGVLIKDLIHWGHPKRNAESIMYNISGKPYKRPGHASKTWQVLSSIITKDGTENPDFIPENVFFFDDLYPEHSIKTELGDNYYRVPRYDFKASAERLGEIYKSVLEELIKDKSFNLNLYVELVKRYSIGEIAGNSRFSELDNLVNRTVGITGKTADRNVSVPGPDAGIDMMMAAIGIVRAKTGGKRRRRVTRTKKRIIRRRRVQSRARKN